jgi:two-component system, chemotaxis family, chemotaxis protein CheY
MFRADPVRMVFRLSRLIEIHMPQMSLEVPFGIGSVGLRRPSEEAMKALVVDSSNTMRSVLGRILSMRGFEVAEADNCRQAMDVLRRMGTADLVLIDWIPHQVDGLEFVTRLRHESAENTRVVMLAATEPGMRELHGALIAGADDYLMKPFTSLQIDEKLAQVGLPWRS